MYYLDAVETIYGSALGLAASPGGDGSRVDGNMLEVAEGDEGKRKGRGRERRWRGRW